MSAFLSRPSGAASGTGADTGPTALSGLVVSDHAGAELPPDDADAIAELDLAWHAERFPDDPRPTREQTLAWITGPDDPGQRGRHFLARLDGRPVGSALWRTDIETDPDGIQLRVYVRPEDRRRGIGTALARRAIETASTSPRRIDIDIAGHVAVGVELREMIEGRFGIVPKYVGRHNRLRLAELDRADIAARLAARRARIEPRYRLDFFEGADFPAPDSGFDVDDFLAMVERIENLMPTEELERVEERVTLERFEALIARLRRGGMTMWTYVARESDSGRCVGVTNIAFAPADPRAVEQWDTGVLAEAQSQGIGTALKLVMLKRVLDDLPGAEFITTENAHSNAAMLAVNDALGFREIYRDYGYQMPIERFRAMLDALGSKRA